MIIKEEIEIHAPLKVAWHVFSIMEEWQNWNTVCQDCCYIEGDEMTLGTCFSFVLRPYYLPIKVAPRITKCEPGREVIWEGNRLGIHAEHRFVFEEQEGKILLTSIERFHGPLLWLGKLMRIPSKLHHLSRQLMAAIKNQAEFCAGLPIDKE